MTKLNIEYLPTNALSPRSNNPRTHSGDQLRQIARSIERFGFTNPVLIDDQASIIAGHGRVVAAKLIGMDKVPCVKLGEMSEAEIRAYVIADNRLAENAGWDREILAAEFAYLAELDIEVDLDLTITGFELPEIDILLDERAMASASSKEEENLAIDLKRTPVTKLGDVWQIGEHRLVCGDALDAKSYDTLLGAEHAQMAFTDPPYNVPIVGHVSGLGKPKHREFTMAAGEMSRDEFAHFLGGAFEQLVNYTVKGAIHFICMDWRHVGEVLEAADGIYSDLKNLCVWSKTNGGMGSLYRSQHELVFVFKSGEAAHINNVELGKHGRNRTNVWIYAGVNTFGEGRDELVLHPTIKPVDMVADAIRDCSHRGGIILDPFAGSGSTLIAAHTTGRIGRAIELDPIYCDVIIERMKARCGLEAVLCATGESYAEVQRTREVPTSQVGEAA